MRRTPRRFASSRRVLNCHSPAIRISAPLTFWRRIAKAILAYRLPILFEEKAGLVRLSLMRQGASVVGERLTPPQSLVRGDDIDADIVAAACSLTPADIETANHRPCIASCGIPLAFAELKSRA